MVRNKTVDDELRHAADEIRRETRDAAAEIRIELGAASRETRAALREAMAEVRDAFGGAWATTASDDEPGSSGRLTRAQRKEMTRELLLDAAIEVFAEKGYHGASLDDVAEAAGFTKGAVYSNFGRKSDLFRALLERESGRNSEALRYAIAAVPYEFLPELAGEWIDQDPAERRDWEILAIEFWLAAMRDDSILEMLRSGDKGALDEFGRALDEKIETAGVDPGLTGRELAVILDALGTGMLLSRYLHPAGGHADVLTRAVRKLIADTPNDS